MNTSLTAAQNFLLACCASMLVFACGGGAEKGSKGAVDNKQAEAVSSKPVASDASAKERPVPVRGVRNSSGDGETVVVRKGSASRSDLGLVASCADKNYAQGQDTPARSDCGAVPGANEAR